MKELTFRRLTVVVCGICALAAVGGCPQGQLAGLFFVDIDPPAPDAIAVAESLANTPPVVDAGGDLTANAGDTVMLDGTATQDPDGDRMLFWWLQTGGTTVELLNGFSSIASFAAPDTTETVTLTFRLTVIDGLVAVTQDVDVVVRP